MFQKTKCMILRLFTSHHEGGDVCEHEAIPRYSEFGPLEIESYKQYESSSKTFFNVYWKKRYKYEDTLSNYEFIQFLGRGTFAEVILAKYCKDEEFYAVKIISKETLIRRDQVEHALDEKRIMEAINCPFTIHLQSFFMDWKNIYFVIPYIPGVELLKYLRQKKKLEECQSRFYMAQVVLALEYLHKLHIAYRDLKPENIMIDQTGYLKLVDFGFSKQIENKRTYTLCGTPEYLAPEVLLGKGYGCAVDWWAVGVMAFELNFGRSPFLHKDTKQVFKNIVQCSYTMVDTFSSDLQDLICHLLELDLTKRYGNLKNGVEDVKQHVWFRPVHWLAVLSRKFPAEYEPPTVSLVTNVNLEKLKCEHMEASQEDKYAKLFTDF